MTIGLIFHLRTISSVTKKIISAVQFSISNIELKYTLFVPNNARIIIVAAAEIIKPNEADFRPFNISNI